MKGSAQGPIKRERGRVEDWCQVVCLEIPCSLPLFCAPTNSLWTAGLAVPELKIRRRAKQRLCQCGASISGTIDLLKIKSLLCNNIKDL